MSMKFLENLSDNGLIIHHTKELLIRVVPISQTKLCSSFFINENLVSDTKVATDILCFWHLKNY